MRRTVAVAVVANPSSAYVVVQHPTLSFTPLPTREANGFSNPTAEQVKLQTDP